MRRRTGSRLSGRRRIPACARVGKSIHYDFFAQTPGDQSSGPSDFYPVHADFGTTTQEFPIGLGACAVPGAIDGIFRIHSDLCRMPIAELTRHAASLANNGVPLDGFLPELFQVVSPIYLSTPESREIFGSTAEPGKVIQAGEELKMPDLGEFLKPLPKRGHGSTTKALAHRRYRPRAKIGADPSPKRILIATVLY